jgi:hypothetical protein
MIEECTWVHKLDHKLYYVGRSMMGEHSVNQGHQIFFEDMAKMLQYPSRVIEKIAEINSPQNFNREVDTSYTLPFKKVNHMVKQQGEFQNHTCPTQTLCHSEKWLQLHKLICLPHSGQHLNSPNTPYAGPAASYDILCSFLLVTH